MDQDQNFTFPRTVNSLADQSGAIPTAATFSDDLQHSNLLYDQLPIIGTAMDDFQSSQTTDQLMTDTWVVWPKQENNYYDNRALQFTNYNYPVWNENCVLMAGQEAVMPPIAATTRSSEAKDHKMAERIRREKLNQRLIALSAVIPGLKKMDKATVLENATEYVKKLQERIETLQKQVQFQTMMESVIVVKKTLLAFDDITNPTLSNESSFIGRTLLEEPLPVIEARFCDKKVLIKVHCDKKEGAVEKILTEITKLHLTVVNSSVFAFGSSALNVTVLAQMNAECCMTEKDLVKTLCVALKSFM